MTRQVVPDQVIMIINIIITIMIMIMMMINIIITVTIMILMIIIIMIILLSERAASMTRQVVPSNTDQVFIVMASWRKFNFSIRFINI